MKVALSSKGQTIESQLEERFGRSPNFIIYDLGNDSYQAIDNTHILNSAQGAGIQAAENIFNTGVDALISGNVGPKAFRALQAAGIDIYLARGTTVKKALDDFKKGKLSKAKSNNVDGHWF